jgi:phosphomethylpyrimidine synthase
MLHVPSTFLLDENTGDVRKYAAEHRLTNAEAAESGMQQKRKEFLERDAEIYAKA